MCTVGHGWAIQAFAMSLPVTSGILATGVGEGQRGPLSLPRNVSRQGGIAKNHPLQVAPSLRRCPLSGIPALKHSWLRCYDVLLTLRCGWNHSRSPRDYILSIAAEGSKERLRRRACQVSQSVTYRLSGMQSILHGNEVAPCRLCAPGAILRAEK